MLKLFKSLVKYIYLESSIINEIFIENISKIYYFILLLSRSILDIIKNLYL